MAYVTTNPPVKISGGVLTDFGAGAGTGGNIWFYRSADAIATVKAAGYFTDALQRGLQVGDIVIVFDSATPALSFAFVQSFTANAANLDGTPLTAT